jgi:hypothetical protein
VTETLSGCIATATVTVTQPTAPLTASATHADVTCSGDADGAIDLVVSGGTTTYTYLWSDSAATEDRSTLSGGTYNVLVTDANGCTATVPGIVVDEPAALTASATPTDVSCNSANGGTKNDGAISLTATGGTGPYTYLWSPGGATTQDVSGLTIGSTYSVIVTDANECTTTANATISEPTALTIGAPTVPDISCNGGSTTLTFTASGGTSSYTGLGPFTVFAGGATV